MATLELVSVACNRSGCCIDWSLDGSGAIFGSSQFISVYDPQDPGRKGISQTLRGHTSRVNAVKFLRRGRGLEQKEVGFVSASSDGSVRIWRKGSEGWFSSAQLTGHTDSVNVLGVSRGLDIPLQKDIIASASADGSVRIWESQYNGGEEEKAECIQVIQHHGKFCLALAFAFLPGTDVPFLVAGGTDHNLTLYAKTTAKFEPLVTLQGHSDWIRSIDIVTFTATENNTENNIAALPEFAQGDLLIASSSQDRTIRLWKICKSAAASSTSGQDSFESMLASLAGETQEAGMKLSTKAHIFTISTTENPIVSPAWVMLEDQLLATMVLVMGVQAIGFSDRIIWERLTPGSFYQKDQLWQPFSTLSGHSASVKGLSWEPNGSYFASVSLDQTTRLFSTWKHDGITSWHEISRPQIHGYDINCISFYKPSLFVSGADEKILRVFEAPKSFSMLHKGLATPESLSADEKGEKVYSSSVPALGLSNKAGASAETGSENNLVEIKIDSPPFEQFLMQHSLWPETNKLYGHAFELVCCASNHAGTLIASSSKATKAEYAAIRLWSTSNWKEISAPLQSHALTVTDVKFSPNDEYLLSVGRDRMWSLFARHSDGQFSLKTSNASHSRIVWTCSWSSCGRYFATASRDKTVRIWKLDDVIKGGTSSLLTLNFDVGATALDFSRDEVGRDTLAVGLENGKIVLFACQENANGKNWVKSTEIPTKIGHASSVNALAWRPSSASSTGGKLQLCSASEDFSVRLFSILPLSSQ
ncbi:Elongator subunit elp2 [Phlyctochytrium planicorne]|nr:Elongator subunit elp2 [Phlyctochytrium planicorne]